MAFKGEVRKHFVVSNDDAKNFISEVGRCIETCGELMVEVQYQPVIQLNGKLLFTAYIVGRYREDE